MVWAIAACAILALIAASFAAIGRFGAMPDPIDDTFRPALPEDRFAPLPASIRFGKVARGYDVAAVDRFLEDCAGPVPASAADIGATRFPLATPGYAPEQVDEVVDRLAMQAWRREGAASTAPEPHEPTTTEFAAQTANWPLAQPGPREPGELPEGRE